MRSNRENDYIGNVLEYDYFPSYSSTRTQKVLVLEYEYTNTITPSLGNIIVLFVLKNLHAHIHYSDLLY